MITLSLPLPPTRSRDFKLTLLKLCFLLQEAATARHAEAMLRFTVAFFPESELERWLQLCEMLLMKNAKNVRYIKCKVHVEIILVD